MGYQKVFAGSVLISLLTVSLGAAGAEAQNISEDGSKPGVSSAEVVARLHNPVTIVGTYADAGNRIWSHNARAIQQATRPASGGASRLPASGSAAAPTALPFRPAPRVSRWTVGGNLGWRTTMGTTIGGGTALGAGIGAVGGMGIGALPGAGIGAATGTVTGLGILAWNNTAGSLLDSWWP